MKKIMCITKSVFSWILVICMIVAMSPVGTTKAFADEQKLTDEQKFFDTENHWARTEIDKWSDLGIIQGNNGNFRPKDEITRGEMAVILDRIMKYQDKSQNQFTDLGDNFYTEAVLGANKAGVILGNSGKVRPADNITRQEAAVMFARALEIKESGKNANFSDAQEISAWAKGYVNAMTSNGYMSGVGSNSFKPKSNITRAEVVKMFDNAIKKIYSKNGEYTETIEGNVIINAPNVRLKNMTITGNLIIAEGVGNGEVYLDNLKIKGDTVVKGGGQNSVYFNSVDVGGALIVNKVGGKLRIVATGTTKVSLVTMESGAVLVTKELAGGQIEKVEIPADVAKGQDIVLMGSFNTVENNAKNIKVDATGSIKNLVLKESATVTGGAKIDSINTAKGAESVVNNNKIEGGKTGAVAGSNTDNAGASGSSGSSGGNSGSSGNSGNTGDTGNTGNQGGSTGWQPAQSPDARFASGYPKSTVVDNKIQLKIKLSEASETNPIEVFMVVNQINANIKEISSQSVIHGHVGIGDNLVSGDETPYICIKDNQEHTILTDVRIAGTDDVNIYFVVKDKNSTSASPTMIAYVGQAITELDSEAPYLNSAYINDSKDKIILHFDEKLKATSVPDANQFLLTSGIVTSVAIENSRKNNYGAVILGVENVTEDQPIINYTGNLLQDNATTPNIVETFSGFQVDEATVSCEKVVASNCGKYIYVELNGGYYFPNSNNPIQFTLKYGADNTSATTLSEDIDYTLNYSYSTDGNGVDIYFTRTSTPTLVEGNKYFIEVNSNGILDYAGDAVGLVSCEGTPSATAESTVAPIVKYDSTEKSLLLDFANDSGLEGRSKACMLTVSAGGVEYRLRGKMRIATRNPNTGDILLTNENFSFDADTFNWTGATISFSRDVHPNADVGDSIIFESGKPYEGFGATTITVIN